MIDVVYAMGGQGGAAPQQGGGIGLFLPMIIVFVIFYFLLIWPQQKKQKQHQQMLDNLKKGDRIMTSGGIHGRIVNIDQNVLTVDIADKVKIKVNRGYIAALLQSGADSKNEADAESEGKKSK